MQIPFTQEQFMSFFATYNKTVFPVQVVGYLLGLGAVWLCLRPRRWSDRGIAAILGAFWLWLGIVFLWMNFSAINPPAKPFGVLLALQGLLFLWHGVYRSHLRFGLPKNSGFLWVGGLMIAYSMVFYPLIGLTLGHVWPRMPVFGVAPCPTTIFTFGLLLWTIDRFPKYLLVIPLIWALIGSWAAISLGVREDIALPISGLVATGMLIWRDRRGVAQGGRVQSNPV